MKDYYYILGVNQNASEYEIKRAHRKLSLKFHPDKNEGDDFFTERFKEIQEAYEILIDITKRGKYDILKSEYSNPHKSSNGKNFIPEIEYFKVNKIAFEYDEEITFSWKTINADKVILKPFGEVTPIGQKTYKIKDFKNSSLIFELTAVNSYISRQIKSSLVLKNKTYQDLFNHFKEQILLEDYLKNQQQTNAEPIVTPSQSIANNGFSINGNQIILFILLSVIAVFIVLIIISA
jgi:curved DNA-binding protein CbpA